MLSSVVLAENRTRYNPGDDENGPFGGPTRCGSTVTSAVRSTMCVTLSRALASRSRNVRRHWSLWPIRLLGGS
jgi:hypothetical protein